MNLRNYEFNHFVFLQCKGSRVHSILDARDARIYLAIPSHLHSTSSCSILEFTPHLPPITISTVSRIHHNHCHYIPTPSLCTSPVPQFYRIKFKRTILPSKSISASKSTSIFASSITTLSIPITSSSQKFFFYLRQCAHFGQLWPNSQPHLCRPGRAGGRDMENLGEARATHLTKMDSCAG